MSQSDSLEATLELLLESWRDHRAPELADEIDKVSARIAPSRTSLANLPKKSVQGAWVALSATRRAGDLAALLDALTVGTIDEIGERLSELERWPEDPRIASAAARLIATVPFQSTSSQRHWTKVFGLVTKTGDFRALAALQEVERHPVAISGGSMRGWMGAAVSKVTRTLEKQFSGGPLALSEAQRGFVSGRARGESSLKEPVADVVPALDSVLPPPATSALDVVTPSRDDALKAHSARGVGLAITPDASQIVTVAFEDSSGQRRFSSVTRLANRETQFVWKSGSGSHAISPDGRAILVPQADGTLALRSLDSGDLIEVLGFAETNPNVPYDRIKSCAWSPRGDAVAVVYGWNYRSHGRITLFRLTDGTRRDVVAGVRAVPADRTNPERLEFSPDGGSLWVLSPGQVRRVDVATGLTVATSGLAAPLEAFTGLAVDPTGSLIATSKNNGDVQLWRADDGAPVATLKGHTGYALSLAFTPDGRGLVSAATSGDAQRGYDPRTQVQDPTVRFWNAHTHARSGQVDLDRMPVDLSVTRDGTHMAVASEHEVKVLALRGHVADAPITELTASFPQRGFEVNALAFARGADVMVSVNRDGAATVWRASRGDPLATWEVGALHALAVSPDGARWVTAGGQSAMVRSMTSKRPLGELKGHTKAVQSVAFSPDGGLIATGSEDRSVILWNASDFTKIRLLSDHRGRVGSLGFTRDGRVLISASDDGTVKLWEVATGRTLSECRVRDGVIRAMGASDDGRVAVTAATDGAALWDLVSATRRCDLVGHTGAVVGAAMRSDGAMAATLGEDATVRLWRVSDGAQVAQMDGWLCVPSVGVNTCERWTRVSGALAFSGNGRLLAVGSGREQGGGTLRMMGW